MALSPGDELKAYLYIRIPRRLIRFVDDRDKCDIDAFRPRHADGLSVFRAHIASPRYVIEQLLQNDDCRDKFGPRPEDAVQLHGWRIAILTTAWIPQDDFEITSPDLDGHVNIKSRAFGDDQKCKEAKIAFSNIAADVWSDRAYILSSDECLMTMSETLGRFKLRDT